MGEGTRPGPFVALTSAPTHFIIIEDIVTALCVEADILDYVYSIVE